MGEGGKAPVYPKMHDLKTRPRAFHDVWNSRKVFEIRRADRDFCCGDVLCLREFEPDSEIYSGRTIVALVVYILEGGEYGLEEGHVCMSIKVLARLGGDHMKQPNGGN